jgi:acyl carrier protein
MASTEVERALGDYIAREIRYDRETPEVAPDEPLLEGALDSTDVLRLVLFVEERFGVRVEDDELVPENFASVSSLAAFIERKQA